MPALAGRRGDRHGRATGGRSVGVRRCLLHFDDRQLVASDGVALLQQSVLLFSHFLLT